MLSSQIAWQQNSLPIIASLMLGLAIVVAALLVWILRRPKTKGPVRTAARSGQEETVVFRADHRGGSRPAASYVVSLPDGDGTYLIPLQDDAGTPGAPIPIQARSLYIGRDQTRAQIVFADPSVSRLHARLIEEVDGVYMLHDEGSASGTFVNDERVDLQPRQLHSGDLIEFGRQRVIFQSADLIGDSLSLATKE